ncbi:MAG: TerC family protein [Myxococcales bacterium]|nr:TerC family protein [Myxococcales bacterium]
MAAKIELWIGFTVIVMGLLALDLGLFNKKAHRVSMREAALWSCVWISLGLAFSGGIYFLLGKQAAIEYLTGYVIEKSLSVDNLFVFLIIFSYFGVEVKYQHRVLYWGIMGALVLRALMIFVGAALLDQFHWLIYVFGAFLVYTGFKLMFLDGDDLDPSENRAVKWTRKLFPMTETIEDQGFWKTVDGKRFATPLLLVLVAVETSDVMFALDSIPAIFGITRDPFLVYTSNVFAILGLRALFFVLAEFMKKFRFLDKGLAIVLGFIGIKMLLEFWHVKIETSHSLAAVGLVLLVAVLLSLLIPEKESAVPDAVAGEKGGGE